VQEKNSKEVALVIHAHTKKMEIATSDLRVPELMHLVIYFVEHIVYVDSATTNPVKRAINSR